MSTPCGLRGHEGSPSGFSPVIAAYVSLWPCRYEMSLGSSDIGVPGGPSAEGSAPHLRIGVQGPTTVVAPQEWRSGASIGDNEPIETVNGDNRRPATTRRWTRRTGMVRQPNTRRAALNDTRRVTKGKRPADRTVASREYGRPGERCRSHDGGAAPTAGIRQPTRLLIQLRAVSVGDRASRR
jgi:hypothetical protein